MRPSLRAQPTPHASISPMHSGPSSHRRRASTSSHSPRPARTVSSKWWLQWSGSSAPIATATVICAITVAPPRPIRLRSISSTRQPARAASIAAYIPAPPAPMTRTSVSARIGSLLTGGLATPLRLTAAQMRKTAARVLAGVQSPSMLSHCSALSMLRTILYAFILYTSMSELKSPIKGT